MKTQPHRTLSGHVRRAASLGSLAVIGALLAACESGPNERTGTAAGAATGAIIGGIIGHQSDEGNKGAAIGAVAGAAIGNEIGEERDERRGRRPIDDDVAEIDYGDLMTAAEKQQVLTRSGERDIDDWGDYLTAAEKRRLIERANAAIGS